MIRQSKIGLNSRGEANPYDETGFLPLITAPMYSVVNETNYQVFLDNKIQVCLPRNTNVIGANAKNIFISLSLEEFKNKYIIQYKQLDFFSGFEFCEYVCIDTANGNIPMLHEAIREAKRIHEDNLVIMAGNVASLQAFLELAKTGVDYIRVGIGGGGGCNTTSNTGVGQEDLEKLIESVKECQLIIETGNPFDKEDTSYSHIYDVDFTELKFSLTQEEKINILKVKIVADGISSYINLCQNKYGFNDNGYAAINKLLFAGADLVMIGKLFAQCVESAGEKKVDSPVLLTKKIRNSYYIKSPDEEDPFWKIWDVKYSGMSTLEEQINYKPLSNGRTGFVQLRPSEGSVNYIPVRWTLNEWLFGSDNQDSPPYLMGWINSIKSAMSYTGRKKL